MAPGAARNGPVSDLAPVVGAWAVVLLAAVGGAAAQAPTVSQRGFVEATGLFYAQPAPPDDRQAIADALLRQEASWRPAAPGWLALSGAFDARAATDDRVRRSWEIDWTDRSLQRPALSVRAASATFRRGGFTLTAGKQFIRWGKADILNPTDRFAPRDLLEVVESDFLAVTGARATCERGANTVDLVWIGLFTPSRVPLAGSRWAPPPPPGLDLAPPGASLPVVDTGSDFPARGQAGIRWNRIASGFEYSLSLFDGYNHLPRLEAVPKPDLGRIEAHRVYPPMRMAGGDFAWPVRWFTLKGEAAYFWTTDPLADDYGLYVIQVERQHGEWLFVGGYAGEFVSADRGLAATPVFAFDRGLARTFLGRASVTLDGLRSVALEGALRDNGAGGWLMAEYSRAIGQHWRATARGDLVRGAPDDFFGRYRRNSGVRLSLRYSY